MTNIHPLPNLPKDRPLPFWGVIWRNARLFLSALAAKASAMTWPQRVELVVLSLVSLTFVSPLTLVVAILGVAISILAILLIASLILWVAVVEWAHRVAQRIVGHD